MVASSGFVNGTEPPPRMYSERNDGYNSRVATLCALTFDISVALLICAGLGYGVWSPTWFIVRTCTMDVYINFSEGVGNELEACANGEPSLDTSGSMSFLNEKPWCNKWEGDENSWESIDSLLADSDSAEGTDNFEQAYIIAICAFASSIAGLIILFNGCCCPLNGRYRAQTAAGVFYIIVVGLGVATLTLISITDITDSNFWVRLDNALDNSGAPVCEDDVVVIQPPLILFGIALVLAFLNIFFSFKVCCCGCCTVNVYEG